MKTTSFRFILAALATTVTLAGCVQEITPPNFENDKVNPASEGSRVIAVSFAAQTKTTLDGFQPRFEDGKDTVLISNTNALDTCVVFVDDKTKVATITTNLTGPLTAVYPYKAAKMSEDNENEIDTVLVSTVQSGKFADANICMAKMKDEKDESLSFENKTAVFCIYPPTDNPEYVEVSADGFEIANDVPTGSTHTSLETIHVNTTTADSVYVSILVPEGLKVSDLSFSDGTNEKTVTGEKAATAIAAGTLYTVTNENWKSPEADTPEGAIKGVFTVGAGPDGKAGTADDVKVYFSQGNLQATYNSSTSTYTWGFAANQYDYIGDAAGNTTIDSQTNGAVVDLFGWSTAITNYGIDTSEDNSNYSGNFVDWGKAYCESKSITPDNTWRTLTKDEWTYLFNTRTVNGGVKEGKSYQRATINSDATGLYGMILYPDHYTGTAKAFYTSDEWVSLENEGCVFLPVAGSRIGSSGDLVGELGFYWSSTASGGSDAYGVYLDGGLVNPGYVGSRYGGFSVRLVTDVSTTPTPTPTAPEGFVDLGVKDVDGNPVYWAERNLGASKPEEYGTYFSWGETGEGRSAATLEINAFTTKPFGWDQDVFWQTFNNGISQSEACPSGVLAQAYDAAYQTNSVWRMPTSEDFTELAKQCFLEWTDNYKGTTNVKGVIVWKAKDGDAGWFKPSASGKGCKIEDDGSEYKDPETHTFSNAYAIGTDSHVFFPAAGIGHGSDLVGASDGGYYWSSSLYTDNTDNAYSLIFESGNVYPRGYFARYYGFSVRPVSD